MIEKTLKGSKYSLEEEFTGDYWINGKPIYRKTINCALTINDSSKAIDTNIKNMEWCIYAYGMALFNETILLPLNFQNSDGWNSFHITGKGAKIQLQNSGTYPTTTSYITLYYTKTTD